MMTTETVKQLQEHIAQSQRESPLSANQVTLMAASKQQPVPVLQTAIAAGIMNFGENRVAEAAEKWPALRTGNPNLRLHLIGALQTNKVPQAIALFDVIHSVDRIKLADALAESMAKTNKQCPCYIQVNTGREPQKAGAMPEEADALIEHCVLQLRLPVVGLMCVPPHNQPPAPHFAWLRQLAHRHRLNGLSMGMSDDFETAVRMGSSCVRLGRVLFGER